MAQEEHANGTSAHAGHHHGAHPASHCSGQHGGCNEAPDAAIDPVCGMSVKRKAAKHRFEYRGQEYFFC